jgi:hypothetical protein
MATKIGAKFLKEVSKFTTNLDRFRKGGNTQLELAD